MRVITLLKSHRKLILSLLFCNVCTSKILKHRSKANDFFQFSLTDLRDLRRLEEKVFNIGKQVRGLKKSCICCCLRMKRYSQAMLTSLRCERQFFQPIRSAKILNKIKTSIVLPKDLYNELKKRAVEEGKTVRETLQIQF